MSPSRSDQAMPLIEQAWLALDSDEEWTHLLLALQTQLHASGVGITTNISPEKVTGVRLEWHGLSDSCLGAYAGYFYAKDPWTLAACKIWQSGIAQGRAPTVLASDDMLPRKDLERSEFGVDFLRANHLADLCKIPLKESKDEQVVLALTTALEDGAFAPASLSVLNDVLPHLKQCYRVRQALHESHADQPRSGIISSESVGGFVAEPVLGRLWLDARGRCIHQDRDAGMMLRAALGIGELIGLGLLLSEADLLRLHQALLDPEWTVPLSFRCLASPLSKLLVVPHFSALSQQPVQARASVYLHAQGRVDQSVAHLLQEIFGVSPSEFRVARLLERGLSPKEIALELNISYSTVRAHLLKLYRKLGVDSQVALVCVYRDIFDSLRG